MKTIEERAAAFGEKHYFTNVESERTSAEWVMKNWLHDSFNLEAIELPEEISQE